MEKKWTRPTVGAFSGSPMLRLLWSCSATQKCFWKRPGPSLLKYDSQHESVTHWYFHDIHPLPPRTLQHSEENEKRCSAWSILKHQVEEPCACDHGGFAAGRAVLGHGLKIWHAPVLIGIKNSRNWLVISWEAVPLQPLASITTLRHCWKPRHKRPHPKLQCIKFGPLTGSP